MPALHIRLLQHLLQSVLRSETIRLVINSLTNPSLLIRWQTQQCTQQSYMLSYYGFETCHVLFPLEPKDYANLSQYPFFQPTFQ